MSKSNSKNNKILQLSEQGLKFLNEEGCVECLYCGILIHTNKISISKLHTKSNKHIAKREAFKRGRQLEKLQQQNEDFQRQSDTKLNNMAQMIRLILSQVSDSGLTCKAKAKQDQDTSTRISDSPISLNQAAKSLPDKIKEPVPHNQKMLISDGLNIEPRWKNKLARKSKKTQQAHNRHIDDFISMNGPSYSFTQDDIDDYFDLKANEDFKLPLHMQETTGAKVNRISALGFYLNECHKLKISFKDYSKKGPKKITRGHICFSHEALKEIIQVAKAHNPAIYAMVMMLYYGALRIQDIIGPTFKQIKELKPNEQGFRTMNFVAKKTSSRNVKFGPEVYDAIISYQIHRQKKDDDIMFKPGDSDTPSKKQATRIERFFAKHSINVRSHDFRTTSATRHYETTKDIMATKNFLGHASVKVTQGYIKSDEKKMLENTQNYWLEQCHTESQAIDTSAHAKE